MTWVKQNWERLAVHLIYVALLAVLWPHTTWMFAQFEPAGSMFVAGAAAFAFEAAIFVLTKRLAKHIEQTPRYTAGHVWLRKAWFRYANAYTVGLVASIVISSVANWAHAVEFGSHLAIYGQYSVDPFWTSVGFGGVLSFVSLLFARVLADVGETEAEVNEEVVALKAERTGLRQQLRATEAAANEAERKLAQTEAAAKLILDLAAEDKARRIEAARGLAAQLPFQVPQSAIAAWTDTSPSYVSEVLRGGNGK